jgi:GWxTD domain-containing protein
MKIPLLLLIAIVLCGCPSSRKISNQNLSHIYKKEASLLHPSFIVYHEDDNISKLFFRIDSEELLYTRQGADADFNALIRISYMLTSTYESIEILDSASTTVEDVNNDNLKKEIIGSIDVKAAQGGNYILEVHLKDMKRGQEATGYLHVDKENGFSRQNFMAFTGKAEIPLFRNYISANEEVKIISRARAPGLTVRHYRREFPLAAPPYSVVEMKKFSYRADSIFTVQMKDEQSVTLKLPEPGIYHFQLDTTKREGFTLFRYRDPFPEIRTPGQLLQPLSYITWKEEYDELKKKPDTKAAVDDFWLKMTSSEERAKEVVRKFYNRVQDANLYFTSYHEGWKTDRGLIYIIYGPPSVVYRSSAEEAWVYGEDKNMMSLKFGFTRVANPFTDNDYVLERSMSYKVSWTRAWETWRQGRVYLEN